MDQLREAADDLEPLIEDADWPLLSIVSFFSTSKELKSCAYQYLFFVVVLFSFLF